MPNKRAVIFFLLLILTLFIYSKQILAANTVITVAPIKDTVAPLQNAVFSVTIQNNEDRDLTFNFKYLDIYWELKINPDPVLVPRGTTKSVELTLVPQKEEKPSVANIIIESTDKTVRSEQLLKLTLLKYNELIDQSSDNLQIPEPVDPRKQTVLRLKLVNLRDIALSDLNLEIKSEFFEQKRVLSLAPYETKTEEFIIDFDEFVKFGNYPVDIEVTQSQKILLAFTRDMRIGNYPKLGETISPESGFFYTKIEVQKVNEGNSNSIEKYQKTFSWWQKLFTDTTPKPTSIVKDQQGYVYTWEFELSPKERYDITIVTSYRGFFWSVVAILVLAFVVYYITKRDISIKKRIVSIRKEQDGTSSVKVLIVVKNKSMATLRNIKVLDRVPSTVDLPTEFGTMHPKVNKAQRGAELIWEIIALGRGEERIFTYKVRSKFKVIGSQTLPVAIAKYLKGGRTLIVTSNPTKLLSS